MAAIGDLIFRAARLLASLVLVLGWAPLLRADQFDHGQLPDNTVWFIHLDVDAARASTLGQGVRELWLKQPEAGKAISKIRAATGMDVPRELHSITLYGQAFSPDQTVIIVRGKINRDHLESVLKDLPGYHRETVGGHDIRFWSEKNADSAKASSTKAGAFFGTDAIVISPTVATLVSALDVLEGKSPALNKASPLAVSVPAGTIVVGAVTGLADASALPIQSPILRKCESGWVLAGERDGQAFMHGRVSTSAAETAVQMQELIKGARALARLQGNPNCQPLLEPVDVTVDGKAVDVKWAFSSRELVSIIQQVQIQQASESKALTAPPPGKNP